MKVYMVTEIGYENGVKTLTHLNYLPSAEAAMNWMNKNLVRVPGKDYTVEEGK